MEKEILALLKESIAVKERLCQDGNLLAAIKKLADLAISCLKNGGKLILFGNGGSAADCQHIAAELVGRFTQERKALAAIALTCNTSNLTAISNDYGFKEVFTRQIAGIGQSKDLAIGISTSGSSPNVVSGITQAKKMGMKTAGLIGEKSPELAKMVDVLISVPSRNTARIQEAHLVIGHIICALIEQALCEQR